MDDGDRRAPPPSGPERDMLLGFLRHERDTLLVKLAGLDEEQVRRTHPPSSLTLLSLVRHLTEVERTWFQRWFGGEDVPSPWDGGDPQAQWRVEPEESTADLVAAYREACAASDRIVLAHALGDRAARPPRHRTDLTLGWVMIHMVQETGRHVGHADLLREAIDGRTGT